MPSEDTNKPVQVQVTNFPQTKQSVDNVKTVSQNIYNLLSGKDYKDQLKKIQENTKNSADDTAKIHTLLSQIQVALSNIKSPSLNQTSATTTTQFTEQQPSYSQKEDTKDDRNWRIEVLQSLVAIEEEIAGEHKYQTEIQHIMEELDKAKGDKEALKRATDEILDSQDKRSKEERRIRNKRDEDVDKETAAERAALENALGEIGENQGRNFETLNSLKRIGNDVKDLFVNGFKKVFEKWDQQIATLKEQGMGGPNAAMLNKMTRRTMDATENALGWNISIDKAIKATNTMIAAGQSPRYLRENNKELITGLSSVGLNLGESTIRAMGQSVFDAQNVKDLTEGWAKIISPDTEGALKEGQISSFLESDDFKKALSTMMMDGRTTYADVQQEIIKQTTEAVKMGLKGSDALNMALVSAQHNLGRGAVTVVPKELQSYIGAAKIAGTFSGDVGNLTRDYAEAVKVAKSNTEVMKRIAEVSASLGQSGDFTMLENIQMNSGHTRNIATKKEIEEGQYEGLVPRITKAIAGIFPAESMGSLSQQLTGDSGFLTKQGFEFFSGLIKDSPQILYLKKIAFNTSQMGRGLDSLAGSPSIPNSGKLGKLVQVFSKWAGPVAVAVGGIAVTAGLMYSAYTDSKAEEKAAEEARKRALESYSKEMSLEQQHRDALLKGNKKLADDIAKQLQQTREQTNQELSSQALALEAASDDRWKLGGAGIGGTVGAIAGGIIGTIIAPGVGTAIGIGIGAALGGGGGYLGTSAAVGSSSPDMSGEISKGRVELSQTYASEQAKKNKYALGGVVEKEQVATIGEENKPEVVIPLTNPERAEELMSQAANMTSADPEVAEMMGKAVEEEPKVNTIADNMIKGAAAQFGKKYSEIQCNGLVEAAMRWAGLTPPVTGVVYKHFNDSRMHLVLNDPEHGISPTDSNLKPGMIMFSHPFTQSEADQLNREKSGHRKAGDPGHMGIYAGDGLWWNSTSSKNTTDYSSGKGVKVTDANKGYGVALTKPITTGTYKLFAAGYYDGMFDEADVKNLPSVSPNTSPSIAQNIPSYTYSSFPASHTTTPQSPNSTRYDAFYSPVENLQKLKDSFKKSKLKYTTLDPQVVEDILMSKNIHSLNEGMLISNNPFGLLNIDGTNKEYESVEAGIQDFISKIEDTYDKLDSMSYDKQLEIMKDSRYITGSEYDRIVSMHSEKLATSIDNLNRSVQESNRLATKASITPIPVSTVAGRRY